MRHQKIVIFVPPHCWVIKSTCAILAIWSKNDCRGEGGGESGDGGEKSLKLWSVHRGTIDNCAWRKFCTCTKVQGSVSDRKCNVEAPENHVAHVYYVCTGVVLTH